MRAADRRAEIERLLSLDREVGVEDLARLLGVTSSTIRRDLSQLTTLGVVTRTYGGAVMSPSNGAEQSLRERSQEFRAEKDAIGRWAAQQIMDDETVLLDAGTTVGRLAFHLRNRSRLTVVTSGLTTLLELANSDNLDLVLLGGEVRHISQGLVGPLAESTLQRLTTDRVFLGADGLVADRGVCEASTVQTSLKELMMARSHAIYVLADSRKLGHAPFKAWAPLERPYTLVTDRGATEEQLAAFDLPHVTTVVVDTPETS
jgi:DeoR/GlpR family transcriptional regulator of sugar metabolism